MFYDGLPVRMVPRHKNTRENIWTRDNRACEN